MKARAHGKEKKIFSVSLGGDCFVNVYIRDDKAEIEPCSHAEQANISDLDVLAAWELVRDKFGLIATPVFKLWHQTFSYCPQVALALDGFCSFPGASRSSEIKTRSGHADGDGGRYSHPMSVEKN